jgi:hypothetical protein
MLAYTSTLFGVRYCIGYEVNKSRVNKAPAYLDRFYEGITTEKDGMEKQSWRTLRESGT